MLRRLPTALAVSPEDITAIEEALARRQAYKHFKKTGEDPQGLFTGSNAGAGPEVGSAPVRQENRRSGTINPNDELRPLPGDKARIVRGKEERIMGPNR